MIILNSTIHFKIIYVHKKLNNGSTFFLFLYKVKNTVIQITIFRIQSEGVLKK